ncbi:hypothetical protein FQZ97_889420 [compost metagenome]
MVGVPVAGAGFEDRDGARCGLDAEEPRIAGGSQQMVEAACMGQVAQQRDGVIQRGAIQHGAREEHARHAGMPLARAQVVDGLDQASAVGAEGVAGQGAWVIETKVAGRVVERHVHQAAAPAQVRVAIFVVGDPAHAVRRLQRDGGAAVGRAVQQIPAAVPEQHVFERQAQAFGQALELFPDGRNGRLCLLCEFVQKAMAAPRPQGLPSAALLEIRGHDGAGQLAQRQTDLAPVSGDSFVLVGHGDSPGVWRIVIFLSAAGWGRMR